MAFGSTTLTIIITGEINTGEMDITINLHYSRRSAHWVKVKNPKAPAGKAEKD